jgi:uncharacterized protein YecE (DUF72 family)
MAGRFFVGTSGFAFPQWKHDVFYPEGTRDKDMLPYYASRLPSVEINYTFRRDPAEKTLATWREITPEGFVFTLKAHQRITHTRRLRNAGEAVDTFLEKARLLGDRLGCTLFQCPPNLPYDGELLDGFLRLLPPELHAAFEFRHDSWNAARPALAERGIAWCVSDTDEHPFGEPSLGATGSLAYLRLRREAYEDDDLKVWAGRIGEVLAGGADVFCYLKHEDGGAGPRWAQRLAELLGATSPVPDEAEPAAPSASDGLTAGREPDEPKQPSFEWGVPGQAGSESPAP